jgi:LuxR family maltose regulon positive regulatory protein
VLREWNQLAEAGQALETGLDLTRQGGNIEGQLIGHIISARVRQAQGDGSGALVAIATARGLLRPGELPAFTPWLAAVEARLWLMQGNLPAAVRWAQACGLDLGDDEAAFHRFPGEYTTLARVFIAQERDGAQTSVLDWLARMLSAMKAKNRTGRVIEILALQALALQAQNNLSQALTPLEQALALAEPEEYVRTFVDEGPPMATLLKQLAADRRPPTAVDYLPKLLAAFTIETNSSRLAVPRPSSLVEPLSQRELEVLRLIAAGYANREIADELVIALGTVKKHISNIYGKLGVQSRTQAIAKGRDLDLL